MQATATVTSASEMEHATAWETGENEYDVRVPARYREYTGAYRVHAIHRECGEITHYVYRVTAKQLAELNKIIELIKNSWIESWQKRYRIGQIRHPKKEGKK